MQAPIKNEINAILDRVTVSNQHLRYVLEVAQPPKQARACGNGPRSSADRRPVDPPPVVKLRIMSGDNDITGFYEAGFMLYASLEFARPIAGNTVYTASHCPVLTGTNVAGAAYLTKPTSAAYFIFPDLSIRHEGYYRLKFHLFEQVKNKEDLDRGQLSPIADGTTLRAPNPQEDMINRTFVYSTPFQVYSAKKFPGLEQSTELSKCIAEQGCRVRIRRDIRQRKSEVKSDKKSDDQRSLRAVSHDRLNSMDSQDHWNRPGNQVDTRHTSIDNQMARPYNPSRQQSYSHPQSSLPSPIISGPVTPRGHDEMWNQAYRNNTYMPPSLPHPNPAGQEAPMLSMTPRSSIGPYSPATSVPGIGLPPISSITSIINPPSPKEPQRPAGGFWQTASPVAKKRALGRHSSEGMPALKDRARPYDQPTSPRNGSGWMLSGGSAGLRVPIVGANDIIEAGDDSDNADDSDGRSEGSILDYDRSYKRADGGRSTVPRMNRAW